jgi:hypothetical protein
LSPVLPLVLYTGTSPWSSNRTLTDLLGEPAALHVFAPSWQPLFWNLADQTAEGLLASGEGWLQMLAVLRMEKGDSAALAAVYSEVMRRLEGLHGTDPVRWYDLMRIVPSWAAWRRPVSEQTTLLAAALTSQSNLARQLEIQTMAQTIAEALIAEGEARGEAKGEVKGEAKGLAKGEILGTLSTLRKVPRRLLEDRFGPLAEAFNKRIENSTDIERLEATVAQAFHVKDLDQLQL